MAFPIDWDEWQAEWKDWRASHKLAVGANHFPIKNLLADEVIGTYRVGGHDVEISEVTFPDFGSGSMASRNRYVGITWLADDGSTVNGGLVETFGELEDALAAGRPTKDVS